MILQLLDLPAILCNISGFYHSVTEAFAILGCYTA